MNKGKISYEGKKVSVGIDVHKEFYVVCVVCEGLVVKRCRMPAKAASVVNFIARYLSGAEVKTCYEAGFSGFSLHRYLEQSGVNNIVIHAASIEVAARDRVKTDKRDSVKLATQLDAGRLRGIRIPTESEERKRLLTRSREQLSRMMTRVRNQFKMKLHQFGVLGAERKRILSYKIAQEVAKECKVVELKLSLESLLSVWGCLRREKKQLERELMKQAASDELESVWRSIPGIGALSSRVLSNELGDMSQFPNERALFSFTGLTPGEYSSGEHIRRGRISRQGNGRLRHILVEAAWRAIRVDELLRESFERIGARQGKKRAIVAIARKLVGRARAVFRTKRAYELGYRKAA